MIQSNSKMNEARGTHPRPALALLAFAVLATALLGASTARAALYSWDEHDSCIRKLDGNVWETYQCNAFFKDSYCDALGCGHCLFVRYYYVDGTYRDDRQGCYDPAGMGGSASCFLYETVGGADFHLYSTGDGSGRWYFLEIESRTVGVSVGTLPSGGESETVSIPVPEIPVAENSTSIGISSSVDFNVSLAEEIMAYYNGIVKQPLLLPDAVHY